MRTSVSRPLLLLSLCAFTSPALLGQERCQLVEEWFGGELDSTNQKVVLETVRKLRERGCQDVVRRRLKNPNASIRFRTAWAVAELKATEFEVAMADVLSDSSPEARSEAVYYMKELKIPGYESRVRPLLNDSSERVRKHAQAYLSLFGSPSSTTPRSQGGADRDAGCDEFCRTLREIIAARGNDFATLRGPVKDRFTDGTVSSYVGTLKLEGAQGCSVSPRTFLAALNETMPAQYTCEFKAANSSEVDADFERYLARVRKSVPSAWEWKEDPDPIASKRVITTGPNAKEPVVGLGLGKNYNLFWVRVFARD